MEERYHALIARSAVAEGSSATEAGEAARLCMSASPPKSGQTGRRLATSALCRYCCKSPKLPGNNFPAIRRSDRRPPICVVSITLPKSPVSLSSGGEVPHIFTRKSRLQPGEFLISSAKRLLQQNLPCVDGSELARLFFTFAGWSVQPCVRPVRAAHKAAGHNALRGSGPGQKPAFDEALAHVGCPDRRIDRLCITCCSPSQPSHHAGLSARSRLRRKCDGFLVALVLGHHGPRHSCNLIGERNRGDLCWPAR